MSSENIPYPEPPQWALARQHFWDTGDKYYLDLTPEEVAERNDAFFWYKCTMGNKDAELVPMPMILGGYRESNAYKKAMEQRKHDAADLYPHRKPIAGPLPDPLDSEITTKPTLVPEWHIVSRQNAHNSRIYQLPNELLSMIFQRLDDGSRGIARQVCSKFMEVICRRGEYRTASSDSALTLPIKVLLQFEESKRTRFNLFPIPRGQLLNGYGAPAALKQAREAALRRQMCAKCVHQREQSSSSECRTARYCTLCEHDQPKSAFFAAGEAADFGEFTLENLYIDNECRLKAMSIRMCEHLEHNISDLLAAGNAAIDLRQNRGIRLKDPDCDANATFGPHLDSMTADALVRYDEHMHKTGGKRLPIWRKKPQPTFFQPLPFGERVRRAKLATKMMSSASKQLVPRGSVPRELSKSDSGEYVEISWCKHKSHDIAGKESPPGFGLPRIVMSHATKDKPSSHGNLSMIWCGRILNLPADAGLTREKLVGIISGLDMNKVPTVCPHVKKLGLKQLALPFAEYQCCCFDAPANVDDPDALPLVAHPHPWTPYNAHIADHQLIDKKFNKNQGSNCNHEPGSDKCCRCYNDDRPGARHTSKRTLMPEWTTHNGEEPPRSLHAYHCNMCATVYSWQRSGRSLFLETRKEVRIDAVDELGWPTGNDHLPGQMFAQFADPEEMLYEQKKGPSGNGVYFCENDNCIVRHDTRVWKEMMHMDPDAGVGRPRD